MVEARITIRKSGAGLWPWQARCSCIYRFDEETYVVPGVGVVGFNTRGIGNRTWAQAMIAAMRHIERRHRGWTTRTG